MNRDSFRQKIEFMLALADVEIGGYRPWDIDVHNDRFYASVLAKGSLGLGEAYMDGWWDCDKLDEFFYKILTAELDATVQPWTLFLDSLKARLFNLQTRSRAYRSGQFHYDIGNDLYQSMLEHRLIYTAGYWKNASSLDEAQENKLEWVGRRLHLRAGMKVLDIGCGWGGTAKISCRALQC